MMTDADILIAGGGLNGPAFALACAQAGLSVVMVDRHALGTRAEAGFDGRAYALAHASKNLLQAIDVWQHLQAVQPILGIKACDGRAGDGASPCHLGFDSAELEEGPMGFMVEDRHLYAAFTEKLALTPRVTVLSQADITGQNLHQAHIGVDLADGRHLTARVLVGCDGRTSGTAQRAGIKRHIWGDRQTALVCALSHERPHQGIAHQLFMQAGPLAILPLAGGHHSSIVWTEGNAAARAVHALSDDDYMAVLAPRFGDFLGNIALAGERFTYPLNFSLAENFIAPRLALVGDAAHGVHPIAGQGLNLGFRDVAALAECLIQAKRRGDDIGSPVVLEAYQHWRRFDAHALSWGMDAINRIFSNDNPLLRFGRDLGLGLVHRTAPLRRSFMREAAGLSGELPRLLQGKAV